MLTNNKKHLHFTTQKQIKLVQPRHIFMKVPVPSQESELSCICVLGVSIFPHSTILIIHFGNVRTVWSFLCFILL
jgi:hypothetical protein